MEKQGKLELTWVGKYEEERLEPRILIEDPEKSNGEDSENMLIHGDNLLALRALENDFSGKIKCVYIDPPYNTGSAFEYYDDDLEHSIWLGLMRERLLILRNLLRDDGFLCCHIDDSEGAYLKVLLDEVFGRQNYLTTIYVRVRYPEKTLKQDMSFHKEIEYIHVYRKSSSAQPILDKVSSGYEKFVYSIKTNGDPQKILELGGKKVEVYQKESYEIVEGEGSEYGLKEIWASGTILDGNSSGRFFRDYLTGRSSDDGLGVLYKVYGIGDDRYDYRYFTGPNRATATKGKYYQGVPMDKLNSDDMTKEIPINGFFDFAANFGNCRHEGGAEFRGGKKPEVLLKMIFSHFSREGDWVLDSFLGSGSTAAVAHKMKRKWIGIELRNQAYFLCKKRLDAVIAGEQTGISKEVNWVGGGGYKFYELAEPLLVKNPILPIYQINPSYTWDMVCEAICKIEGFTYDPSGEFQGYSSENRFIHITEEFVNSKYVMSVMKNLGDNQSLIIYCKKNQADMNLPENVEVKKIPKDLLEKCNFGAIMDAVHDSLTVLDIEYWNANNIGQEIRDSRLASFMNVRHFYMPSTKGKENIPVASFPYTHVCTNDSDSIELVITAPETFRIKTKKTRDVVEKLIKNAEKSVVMTGYSISDYFTGMLDTIIAKSQQGVYVRFYVNDIEKSRASLVKMLAYRSKYLQFFEYEKNSDDKMAASHAKILTIDSDKSLVSSANLSYHGLSGNIEMGFLVRSADKAKQIEELLKELVRMHVYKKIS